MSSTGLLEDLGLYLAAASSRLAVGTSLFGYQLPDSTSNPNVSSTTPVVALIPEIGFLPVRKFVSSTGGGLPAFEKPVIRVRVRSTEAANGQPSPTNAFSVAAEVHRLFEKYPPNSTVSGGKHGAIGAIEAMSPPHVEDRDSRGRYELSFRVMVWDSSP